jgi:hypothetical protein
MKNGTSLITIFHLRVEVGEHSSRTLGKSWVLQIVISTIIFTITATPIQTGERHSLKVLAHDWNHISEFNRGLELILCDHHATALFNLWTLFGLEISLK